MLPIVLQGVKPMNKTVKEIVRSYLTENGYDGLYCEDCGCEIKDLCPFDEPCLNCQAGYKTKCIPEDCSLDGDCDFHIRPDKHKENIEVVGDL